MTEIELSKARDRANKMLDNELRETKIISRNLLDEINDLKLVIDPLSQGAERNPVSLAKARNDLRARILEIHKWILHLTSALENSIIVAYMVDAHKE